MARIEQLRRRATSLTRNRADAEDLLQDTLERALRSLARLRPGPNVGAWLNTMMNHRFIDEWRMGKRTRPLEAAEHVAAPAPEEPPPWSALTEADIKRGMEDLPPAVATILQMRYFHRLSYAEIARRLGTTGDTVGTRLFRARRSLRGILTAKCLQPSAPAITPPSAAPRKRGPRQPSVPVSVDRRAGFGVAGRAMPAATASVRREFSSI